MVADLIDWIKMSLIFHYVNVHLRRGGGSSKWSFEVDHHKIICHFICPKKAAATRPPHLWTRKFQIISTQGVEQECFIPVQASLQLCSSLLSLSR